MRVCPSCAQRPHIVAPLAKALVAECVGVCLAHLDVLGALAGDGLEALGAVVQGGVVGFVRGLVALPPVQAVAILARLAALLMRPSGAFSKGLLEGIATGLWDGVTGLVDMIKDVALLAKGVAKAFNVVSVALDDPALLAQLETTAQELQTQLAPLVAELSTPQGLAQAKDLAQSLAVLGGRYVEGLAEGAGQALATSLVARLGGGDEAVGQAVGGIAGSVLFNVALTDATDGAYLAAKAVLPGLVTLGVYLKAVDVVLNVVGVRCCMMELQIVLVQGCGPRGHVVPGEDARGDTRRGGSPGPSEVEHRSGDDVRGGVRR